MKFGDILEGVTMEEKVDERTGLSTKVVIDTKDVDKRPRISIKDADGQDAQDCRAATRRATCSRSART